jgi:hypothetical protein
MMSANQHPSPLINASIDEVRRRLARWRRNRQKGSRIPEPLWKAAVQVARRHGLNATARALRLDYYDLRQRLEAAAGPARVGESSLSSFVELIPAARPTGHMPAAVSECVLEREGARGRLRIELKGIAPAELVGLSRALWDGEA